MAEDLRPEQAEVLQRAVRTVNGLQAQFVVRESIRGVTLPGKHIALKTDASFEALRRRSAGGRLFCVTNREFAGNEFQQVDERCSLLTVSDWEELYAPPSLHTYIVYQFAFAFAVWAANNVSERVLTHPKTIGCRMDYCRDKRDLRLGMLAGYICAQCHGQMRQLDATPRQIESIERILDYVRLASKGDDQLIEDWHSVFVVMRFSDDRDENQTAYEKAIVPGLRKVGLKATRADDQVQPRPLLEKVTQQIASARFILAKVDVERMNVYYELGLAMGQKKEVLLVSEQSKVKMLPSDLTNWECFTYPRGNYAVLRQRVAVFYR